MVCPVESALPTAIDFPISSIVKFAVKQFKILLPDVIEQFESFTAFPIAPKSFTLITSAKRFAKDLAVVDPVARVVTPAGS